MEKTLQKNHGLNLELEKLHASPEDWHFGAMSGACITDIPEGERERYLPRGERQDIGEEKMDCATRSPLNELELKFNWLLKNKKLLPENEQWFRDNGYITENSFEFSDVFIAILSGTTRQGNSLKAPLQAIHEYGLIPKSKLPQLHGFDENYDPKRVTGSLKALGEQFKSRFKINYEKVDEVHYKQLLKEDMLGTAGYAWPQPVNGEYPKSDLSPNHAFLIYKNQYYAFDNYEESSGDYIKKLAPDYDCLGYGYRVYITAQYLPSSKSWIADIISNLWQAFFPLKEKVDQIAPLQPKEPIMETNAQKFYQACVDALDTDPSTPDAVQDELGCADTMSTLIKRVFPDFPHILSTADLFQKMKQDKRFSATLTPKKGCIIISPRTATKNGHVGYFITDERIASNISFGPNKGKFMGGYSWNSWINEFRDNRSLKIYLFVINN